MKRLLPLLLLAASLFAGACTGAEEAKKPAAGKDSVLTVEVGGAKRTCLLHLSAGYERGKRRPLVLAFHGLGGSGKIMAKQTGFARVADREGFIVAFPDGENRMWRLAPRRGEADVEFVRRLISELSSRFAVDADRIYACGHSNGAAFVLRLAAEMGDRLAAVAAVSGFATARGTRFFVPSRPLPVMLVNGTADRIIPYEGGEPKTRFFRGEIKGAEELFALLADAAGCEPGVKRERLADKDPADGVRVEILKRTGGKGGAEVWLYKLVGGGHAWPRPGNPVKGACRDFDGAEAIWAFFSRHKRTAPGGALRDIRYGPHERNTLDLYPPTAKREGKAPCAIFVHGGGFVAGDKRSVPPGQLSRLRKKGIAVASLNYRFTTQAPFPAPMLDAARAVQYLRAHADEYGLDPERFAAWGSSAGADISMWLGFHDDLADPRSPDPVARCSTRLKAVGSINGQTTLDPWKWREMFGFDFFDIFHTTPEKAAAPEARKRFAEASAVTHVSKDDPPVYFYYSQPNRPPRTPKECVHHPRFGELIRPLLEKAGVEYWLVTAGEKPVRNGRVVEARSVPAMDEWLAEMLR